MSVSTMIPTSHASAILEFGLEILELPYHWFYATFEIVMFISVSRSEGTLVVVGTVVRTSSCVTRIVQPQGVDSSLEA